MADRTRPERRADPASLLCGSRVTAIPEWRAKIITAQRVLNGAGLPSPFRACFLKGLVRPALGTILFRTKRRPGPVLFYERHSAIDSRDYVTRPRRAGAGARHRLRGLIDSEGAPKGEANGN